MSEERYFRYSSYLKGKYGTKTYKLTVNLPLSCPNRDGLYGNGGCMFCGEDVQAEAVSAQRVREQLLQSKDSIARRYGAEKFIAYFQSFSNTYMPSTRLKPLIEEACAVDDVVEISLGTRPDCVSDRCAEELVHLLQSLGDEVNLTFEFGLQTINHRTLKRQRRGHTLAEFIDAVLTAGKYGIEVCTHLILNLPGDDLSDCVEAAKILSALKVDTVKLHALFIHRRAPMAESFRRGEVDIIPVEEYVQRVIAFLRHLSPDIAVQRLLGRAPKEDTLFVNWGLHWREIHQMIVDEMLRMDARQGDEFGYLDGKALRKAGYWQD